MFSRNWHRKTCSRIFLGGPRTHWYRQLKLLTWFWTQLKRIIDQFTGLQGFLIFHYLPWGYGSRFAFFLWQTCCWWCKEIYTWVANYTVPQIAKLTITATLVKKQRRLQSHSQHQGKLRVRSFHRLLTTSKAQSVPFVWQLVTLSFSQQLSSLEAHEEPCFWEKRKWKYTLILYSLWCFIGVSAQTLSLSLKQHGSWASCTQKTPAKPQYAINIVRH